MSGRRRPVLAALVAAPIAIVGAPALAVTQIAPADGAVATDAAAAASATGASKPQAPSLRTGLAVPAPGVSPGDAALAYAQANHRGTGDLRVIGTDTDSLGTVVRLGQSVGGIPVLGGQLIVRLTGTPGAYVARGTTDATAPGLTGSRAATWSPAALQRIVAHLAERRFPGEKITAKVGEQVILPFGAGVLTHRVTVTLARSGDVRDVYVAARTGAVILDIDRNKSADVVSTERNLAGQSVTVHADKQARNDFVLTDSTRAPSGPTILGQYVDADLNQFPVNATKLPFGAVATNRGSIDAHLDVAAATDYYTKVLGRNGIDGAGGDIIHVTGAPMVNAYWDGIQMVIGLGDAEYKPLSADVDVVAHELTHGVIDHTAGFIYMSQGGAMHEAYADYYGNAVDNGQTPAAMTKPRNGLLGEDLCRTLTPVKCAIRNLDDGRTVKDYTGTLVDIGGVHLNATIYGGALWDIRQALDPTLADKVIYRGLTAYLTPWATFTDGRAATLAAADDLRLTAAQKAVIAKAFDSRGIKTGWETSGRTDADRVLASDLPIFSDWFPPVAGGGRWAVADLDPSSGLPTAVKTGLTAGGTPERVVVPNGQSVGDIATDGRYVLVTTGSADGVGVWLYDTATKRGTWLAQSDWSHFYVYPTIAGGRVAWQDSANGPGGEPDVKLSVRTIGKNDTTTIDPGGKIMAHFPSLSSRLLVHVQGTVTAKDLVVRDAKTLTVIASKQIVNDDLDSTFIPTALTDKVLWTYVDWHRDWPLGPKVTAYVSPSTLASKRMLNEIPLPAIWPAGLTAQATETSMTQIRPKSIVTAHPEVIQKPLAGGNAVPVTCDKGGAYLFAADEGQAVVWLSGAQGKVDLVMRSRPAGPCR